MPAKVNIAGMTFVNKTEVFLSLKPVGELTLEPDPANKYDPEAVAVVFEGTRIGYLPNKEEADKKVKKGVIKMMADDPKSVVCTVDHYAYHDDDIGFNEDHIGRLQSVTVIISRRGEVVEPVEDKGFTVTGEHYEKGGKKYMRLTKLLSHFNDGGNMDRLIKWACDFGSYDAYKTELESLADAGTAIHLEIENWLKGDKTANVPAGFLNWHKKYEPKVISMEQTLFNDEFLIAGTYDFLCEIKGEVYAVDWKSSKAVREKHRIQGGWYAKEAGAAKAMVVAFGAKTKQGYSCSIVEDVDRRHKQVCMLKQLVDM